jgi:hypothetical protein
VALRASVSIGHVRRYLFMSSVDELDRRVLELGKNRNVRVPAQAEHVLDASIREVKGTSCFGDQLLHHVAPLCR